jgi:hypothetical protein
MSTKKGARSGGKYTGSHTTVVPSAGEIADIAERCSYVTKIALGFIKAGLPSAKGLKRLKVMTDEGSLLFTVRGNTSQQELRVYATDVEAAKHMILRDASAVGFKVTE